VRSFLHVADVGAAFAAVLGAKVEGAVNVGSGEGIALAELIDKVAQKIGRPDLVRLGARAAGAEPPLVLPTVQRLREECAWRPRFDLDEGLADTIRWWRTQLSSAPT
jgi:nucleoside-diphosphate-sugar epimerase